MSSKKVAVIGAGTMGLATAYFLSKKGYTVTVFESEKDIGGMAVSFDFDGIDIERFYHFHCTSDYDYFEMLKELGLEDKLHWRSTSMGFWFNNELQPWGNPIALLKFRGISLIAKFRYGLHAFFSVKRNRYDDLDKIESTSWIKKWVGKEAWEKLWSNLFSLKFYEYSDKLSAAWIWSRIRRIGRSRYNVFKEKLGYLEGGSKPLIKGMAEKVINNSGTIFTSTPVKSVLKTTDGKYTVVVDSSIGTNYISNSEVFDAVVSTIPLPYLPSIFEFIDKEARNKFAKTINIGVVCIIVKLAKALSDNFWLNTNDPEMDIPGIIEYSNLNPCDGQHIVYVPYYMPISTPIYNDSDNIFKEKIIRYFKKINPSLNDEDFLNIVVSRYKCAQPICGPEYLKTIPEIKIMNDNVFIADTSYYYPEDRGVSEGIKIAKTIAGMVENELK